jgi:hypothetical protein
MKPWMCFDRESSVDLRFLVKLEFLPEKLEQTMKLVWKWTKTDKRQTIDDELTRILCQYDILVYRCSSLASLISCSKTKTMLPAVLVQGDKHKKVREEMKCTDTFLNYVRLRQLDTDWLKVVARGRIKIWKSHCRIHVIQRWRRWMIPNLLELRIEDWLVATMCFLQRTTLLSILWSNS